MKIEIIAGSPRVNSVTRRVAVNLKKWLDRNTDHETGIIDMKDWNLPPVQSVLCLLTGPRMNLSHLLKEFSKLKPLYLRPRNTMAVIRPQ